MTYILYGIGIIIVISLFVFFREIRRAPLVPSEEPFLRGDYDGLKERIEYEKREKKDVAAFEKEYCNKCVLNANGATCVLRKNSDKKVMMKQCDERNWFTPSETQD